MANWFTLEKADSATFIISEYQHWEQTHCYLVCGTQRAALIDSGLGVANIQKIVASLTTLPVLVLTTHAHWDHIGGHQYFSDFAVHEAEKSWLAEEFPLSPQAVIQNLTRVPCDFPPGFRVEDYQVFQGFPQRILHDGDWVDLGGRRLAVIHTPGHSPGHCCFYEPERQYLFSGDLIYSGCLDAFYPTTDPQLFLQSVRKIQSYRMKRIFPAHHRLDVPVSLPGQIENAFCELESRGILKHGAGFFDFGSFQIHI